MRPVTAAVTGIVDAADEGLCAAVAKVTVPDDTVQVPPEIVIVDVE